MQAEATKPVEYPEHEKLREVSADSQVIGEFLDYKLPRLGIALYEERECECECSGCENDDPLRWHTYEELAPGLPVMHKRWVPVSRTITAILAEAFDIDQAAIDREKDAMLDVLRSMSRASA